MKGLITNAKQDNKYRMSAAARTCSCISIDYTAGAPLLNLHLKQIMWRAGETAVSSKRLSLGFFYQAVWHVNTSDSAKNSMKNLGPEGLLGGRKAVGHIRITSVPCITFSVADDRRQFCGIWLERRREELLDPKCRLP